MSRRGPDKRPRLKPGEVRCVECQGAMLEAAAVLLNKQPIHPIGCFPKAFERYMAGVRLRLDQNLGTVDFSVSMESVSPETAYELGKLTSEIIRSVRRPR